MWWAWPPVLNRETFKNVASSYVARGLTMGMGGVLGTLNRESKMRKDAATG